MNLQDCRKKRRNRHKGRESAGKNGDKGWIKASGQVQEGGP